MSRETVFYLSEEQLNSSGHEIGDNSRGSKANVDENFLRISKCLDEADIYMSTSKSYIDASKKSIDSLKESITCAEADLNTAEECIMECEMRMQSLKGGLQALFNASFYENLDTVPKETMNVTNETEATIQSLDRDGMPMYISHALQKYANESKINLENYEASFGQYGDLMFIVMHPKDKENKPGDQMSTTTSGSNFQQNPSLDNLILKNVNDIYSGSGCRPKFSQSHDDFRNINAKRKGSHPCSQMYLKQNTSLQAGSSVRMAAFNRGLTRDKQDTCRGNTFKDDGISSGMSSGTVDLMQKVSLKQNTTLDKMPNLIENLNRLSFNARNAVPQKSACSEMGRTFDSSDVSLLRLSGSSEAQSNKQMTVDSSQREAILVKIHSNSSDSEWESSIQKRGRRRKSKNKPSDAQNNQSEDLIQMSPSHSTEAFTQLLRQMRNINSKIDSDVNQAEKNERNRVGTSNAETNIHISDFTRTYCPFNETSTTFSKNDLPEIVPVNNLSQLVSCRPKTSQSFRNKGSSLKNEWVFDDSSEADVRNDMSTKKKIHNRRSLNSRSLRDLNARKGNLNSENHGYVSSTSENNNTFNKLPFVNSTETKHGSCANKCSYDTVYDYSHKKFRTPQYKNRCKSTNSDLSLSFDCMLEQASFGGKWKQNTSRQGERGTHKISKYFTSSSVANSTSNDENTATNSSYYSHVDDDKFFKFPSTSSLRNTSKSPSYISFPDEVLVPESTTVLYFENVLDSDVASTSTAMDMSSNTRVRDDHTSTLEADDSCSSGNAYTSESIYVNTSYTSFNSESETKLNETFTEHLQNDLPENTTETEQFENSSHRRDSTDSFVTVYEAPADAARQVANLGLYNSAQMIERSMLAMISEELESSRGMLPHVPVSAPHSRNAMFSYVPPARLSTSTPRPDSSPSQL